MSFSRWLRLPGLIWYLIFVLAPLVGICVLSFQTRGPYGGYLWRATSENYRSILESNFLLILGRSLMLSFQTGLLTTCLGLMVAWAVISARESWRPWLLSLVILPFLINLIIRIYAVRSFVGYDGPLQTFLKSLGVNFDPFVFTGHEGLVYFGMVTNYLPFAVLPLYSGLGKFDFTYFEAAQDLGASATKAFFQVVIPQLTVPLLNAFVLVFIPALGEYVIPDLLGGAKTMYLGNLLTEQFLKARDWPVGSALAVTLILILCLALFLLDKLQKREDRT